MAAIFMESVESALGSAFFSVGQRVLDRFKRDVGKCHYTGYALVTKSNETNDDVIEPNNNDVIAPGKREGWAEEEEVDRREMNDSLGSSFESNGLNNGLDNCNVTTGNGFVDVLEVGANNTDFEIIR